MQFLLHPGFCFTTMGYILVKRISAIIALCMCLIVSHYAVAEGSFGAEGSFWADPVASTSSFQSEDATVSSSFRPNSNNTQISAYDYQGQSSLNVVKRFGGNQQLGFQYSQGLEQRGVVLGYSQNNLSVSYMAGKGEDVLEIGGQYNGVDPFLFHGGWDADYNYDGFAFDYAAGKFGHIQYGEATVQADGLADRTAKYFEWSNNRVFARATRFSRGADSIGRGFDAGFAFGNNKQIAVQAMKLDNNRSMQRLRLQFDGARTRQYWVDLSSHQNDLFRDNNDVQIMFSFKTLLGSKSSLISYANEVEGDPDLGEEPGKKKKGKGLNRAVFIGLGVAAAAGISSSGSDSADGSVRRRTQDEAAFDVLNGINPTSVRENREYGGWVFVNPDGSFSSTNPVRGEAASVNLPNPAVVIPGGSRRTASYHTHAGFDPRFDNENFSPTDLNLDRQEGVDGYLATPGGQFKKHIIATDEVVTLGSIAN